MSGRFEGKAVLVTGAGVGIGYAICHLFAQEGAIIALNDLREDAAQQAAKQINHELKREAAFPYAFDVANVDALREAVADFDQRVGRFDIVVANAGITNYGAFLDYTPEAFDRLTSVNLRGTYFTAQAAAKAMIVRGNGGRVILTSSVTGVLGYRNLGAYGITKAGILLMTKNLAVELGGYGITVNAIIPGITRTDRTVEDDPDMDRNWASVTPTGKVSEPEDAAAAVAFLASPEAKQITGQALAVDGGWTSQNPIPQNQPEKTELG